MHSKWITSRIFYILENRPSFQARHISRHWAYFGHNNVIFFVIFLDLWRASNLCGQHNSFVKGHLHKSTYFLIVFISESDKKKRAKFQLTEICHSFKKADILYYLFKVVFWSFFDHFCTKLASSCSCHEIILDLLSTFFSFLGHIFAPVSDVYAWF